MIQLPLPLPFSIQLFLSFSCKSSKWAYQCDLDEKVRCTIYLRLRLGMKRSTQIDLIPQRGNREIFITLLPQYEIRKYILNNGTTINHNIAFQFLCLMLY